MRELSKGKLYISNRCYLNQPFWFQRKFFLALQHSLRLLCPVKDVLFITYFNLHYLLHYLRITPWNRQHRDSYPHFIDEYAECRKHCASLNHRAPKWESRFATSGSLTAPPPWQRSTHVPTLSRYEVWWGPACLLSLNYCTNRGPCKLTKWEGLPAKPP